MISITRMVKLEKAFPLIGFANMMPIPKPTTAQTNPTSGATIKPGNPPNAMPITPNKTFRKF